MPNFYKKLKSDERGVATLEMLIALALICISISAVILVVFGSQSTSLDTEISNEALYKSRAMLEDVRATSREDFNSVTSTQTPATAGCPANFISDGIYCKQNIVTVVDSFTKNVTNTVKWTEGTRTLTTKLSTLLTVFSGGQTVNNFSNSNCSLPPLPTTGPDLGSTNHTAINFSANNNNNIEKSCLSTYDGNPNTFGSVTLEGDVLIHGNNNEKGAGFFALYNIAPNKSGLLLVVGDNGITDRLRLYLVHQDASVTLLQTQVISTANGFKLDNWYRLTMQVTVGANISVTGKVFGHSVVTNPNSALTSQVGSSLVYTGTPAGVDSTGKAGVAGWSKGNADLRASVTNFIITPN